MVVDLASNRQHFALERSHFCAAKARDDAQTFFRLRRCVSFGAAAGVVFQDQWSIKGGGYDANGTQTTYDAFSEGGEFVTHRELSWAPSRAERHAKEIHLIGWHVDRRDNAGVPESRGIAISGNWTFNERWMPFFRVGWSDGEAPLMNRATTLGS